MVCQMFKILQIPRMAPLGNDGCVLACALLREYGYRRFSRIIMLRAKRSSRIDARFYLLILKIRFPRKCKMLLQNDSFGLSVIYYLGGFCQNLVPWLKQRMKSQITNLDFTDFSSFHKIMKTIFQFGNLIIQFVEHIFISLSYDQSLHYGDIFKLLFRACAKYRPLNSPIFLVFIKL